MPSLPPLGNISGEVTMQELLSNRQLIPGMLGANLKVEKGAAICFADLAQLTINHDGVEFLLTREVKRFGRRVVRRWRIYSGTTQRVLPPKFFNPHGPAGATIVERVVGHTHPRSIPFELLWIQPSREDIINLRSIISDWQRVHGPQSEPFGRIIWGLIHGETTSYGVDSTEGNAVPPPWLRR
jgi:hypothetical protein